MKNKKLKSLILTSLFAALVFVSTYIQIPLPTGGMIHLGNFTAIVASLLFGPIIGGLSGSVGMGLFDLINGYPPETYLRSFILKFVVCFIIGVCYKLLKRKETNSKVLFIISSMFLLFLSVSLTLTMINGPYMIQIGNKTIEVNINYLTLAFVYFINIVSIFLVFFKTKNKIIEYAIIATILGLTINVIGEFGLRIGLSMITGYDFKTSYFSAIAKIPASLLTSVITVVLVGLLFPILNRINRTE